MRPKETSLNTGVNNNKENGMSKTDKQPDAVQTPVKPGAFDVSDDVKIKAISKHFEQIMDILGLDIKDESLQNTPDRVAKMFVNEIFHGLKPENKPEITLFENKFGYDRMLLQRNISVFSFCEHHFLPIIGKAHVAYFSGGKIAGLSKLNRIVDYYSRRPQVQERLTSQIAIELKEALKTDDVAVIIDARHLCVSARGIQDVESRTISSKYFGKFLDKSVKDELFNYLHLPEDVEAGVKEK